MKFRSLILFTGLLALSMCVDPFSTQPSKIASRIVVEGSITDREPPYSITLTNTANYSRNLDGITTYVSGATVKVCDDEGNCIDFYENEKGRYRSMPDAAKGQVGNSYHVEIVTSEGKKILSYPEKMLSAPPIARAYMEYDPEKVLDEGYRVYIDTNDPPAEHNYYKWETVNYYPYSKFCFTRETEALLKHVASDRNIDGNTLSRVLVRNVPFGSTTHYVVQIYQLAISSDAYEFFDQVNKQTGISGSIFDPPPAFIRGNLYNPDDSADEVLGYFLVAGSQRMDIVVDRSVSGLTPRPFAALHDEPLYCGDPCDPECVSFGHGTCGHRPCPPDCASLPGNTNIAPDAWPFPHQECGD